MERKTPAYRENETSSPLMGAIRQHLEDNRKTHRYRAIGGPPMLLRKSMIPISYSNNQAHATYSFLSKGDSAQALA